jgi:hypothetical protein
MTILSLRLSARLLLLVIIALGFVPRSFAGTVVSSVFSSTTADRWSYLRLTNPTRQAGDVVLTFRDSSTSQDLWRTTVTVAPNASPQMRVIDLEAQFFAGAQKPARYDVDVTSEFTGSVQHIVWSPSVAAITNVSTCGAAQSRALRFLNNVHTRFVQGYPSRLIVRNVGDESSSLRLDAHDVDTGTFLFSFGPFAGPDDVPPGGSRTFDVAALLDNPNLGLDYGKRQQINLFVRGNSGLAAAHVVDNENVGITTNMTDKCDIGPGTLEVASDPRANDRTDSPSTNYKTYLNVNGRHYFATAAARGGSLIYAAALNERVLSVLRDDLKKELLANWNYVAVRNLKTETNCVGGGLYCLNVQGSGLAAIRSKGPATVINGQQRTLFSGDYIMHDYQIVNFPDYSDHVHELSHLIHLVAISNLYPDMMATISANYAAATAAGRLKGLYAAQNEREYFAEFAAAYLTGAPLVGQTGNARITNRDALKAWDPQMFSLIEPLFNAPRYLIFNDFSG